jgi:hypothetical protein
VDAMGATGRRRGRSAGRECPGLFRAAPGGIPRSAPREPVLPIGHLASFALISFALIIVPGPNVLLAISRPVMLGRGASVGTAVGGQIDVCLQAVAVAFGMGR